VPVVTRGQSTHGQKTTSRQRTADLVVRVANRSAKVVQGISRCIDSDARALMTSSTTPTHDESCAGEVATRNKSKSHQPPQSGVWQCNPTVRLKLHRSNQSVHQVDRAAPLNT
jgi:hypothetical protein